MEEDYQEEARKRKEWKKEKKAKEATRGRGKTEIIEEVIKRSQRMALGECCLSERKRTEGQPHTKVGLLAD